MSTQPAAAAGPVPRRPHEVIDTLAREIAADWFPPGDRAALRREDTPGPAFWRLVVRHLEPAGLYRPGAASERRWAALLALLARGADLHRRGLRLGAVLAEAEVSESRVTRLVRAQDDALLEAVRTVAHLLVSGGHRVDLAAFAELVLSAGTPQEDEVRNRLCLEYYRARDRRSRESPSEEES